MWQRRILNPEDIKSNKIEYKVNSDYTCIKCMWTIVDIKAVGEIAKEHNVLYLVMHLKTLGLYDIDVNELNVDMIAAQDISAY